MTPRRARLALALFLLLAAAVAHTALIRQSRPSLGGMGSEVAARPRPRVPKRTSRPTEPPAPAAKAGFAARAMRLARVEPDAAASEVSAAPASQPAPTASVDTIRA